MLSRVVQAGLSSSSFNVLSHFKTLKSMISTPMKHIKQQMAQDDGVYKSTWINVEAEAQDEVAHQWYALYTQNPFHLQVYNNLENIQTVQFGTVDNPVAIFTADAPYRYVGCTGLQNEDDYEQHEMMMFMLREGPMQRCPTCGQVFKLIRLRPEWTEEMDFYSSCFHPLDPTEMGASDNIQMMNLFKMHTSPDPTTSEFYYADKMLSPINADEHDRLLIDPAYRLWKHRHAADKYIVIAETFRAIEKKIESSKTQLKMPLQKRIYETVIEAERAYEILERHQKKVARFQSRELLDYENHTRRESRMSKSASLRWDDHYSYFFGGLTEEEQRYRDYYQTDYEKDPEDEMIEQQIDQQMILQQDGYSPKLFDFQEVYTHNPEDDQTTLLEKKFFKFLYRAAEDSIEDYKERSKRMVNRQIARLSNPERQRVFNELNESTLSGEKIRLEFAQKTFYETAAEEGLLLYKDYYEGVPEAEVELVETLYKMSPLKFLPIYTNFASRVVEHDGFVRIPKRQWDYSQGLLQNYQSDLGQFIQTLAPTAQRLSNRAKLDEILPESDQILLQSGLKEAQDAAKQQLNKQTQEPKTQTEEPVSKNEEPPMQAEQFSKEPTEEPVIQQANEKEKQPKQSKKPKRK